MNTLDCAHSPHIGGVVLGYGKGHQGRSGIIVERHQCRTCLCKDTVTNQKEDAQENSSCFCELWGQFTGFTWQDEQLGSLSAFLMENLKAVWSLG